MNPRTLRTLVLLGTLLGGPCLFAAEGDTAGAAAGRLTREAIVVRGNTRHPCVNLTADDVAAARQRVERFAWAQAERDDIVKRAAFWIEKTDEYWLSFLPKPGAAYAYGFTGCPICNSRTGTWGNANCSWDKPGQVKCAQGHLLPDAEHPDPGTGYVAPDKRIHYLVGQFNAWATEQWTTRAIPVLAQAYLLTGDERYAERGILLLDALASIYKESTAGSWDYPSNPPSGRLARPWYQVARTLVMFVDQYDWLYNSPAMAKPSLRAGFSRRDNIEQNLLIDGAWYCYFHSWGGSLNNGHADYLRGALSVGCLLDVPAYIDAAVNGPFSINVMLSNNIDRSGLYYETSPGYAIHSRHLYLTYAEPLFNLRNKEYPAGLNLYDDPRLQATVALPDLQIQLAGRRPNFGDCAPEPTYVAPPAKLFNETDYGFAERLFARVSSPEKRREYGAVIHMLAGDNLESLRAKHERSWLLWHAAEAPTKGAKMPAWLEHRITRSWTAGMYGISMLRDPLQSALLRFGPSLNHGDPDEMALLYYANGYEYSYDIGYGLASTHVQVGWGTSTVSHALVTVNEKNQLKGSDGSGGSLLGFAELPSVRFVEADSPLSYEQEGVREYRRAVAMVGAGYLVDCFRVVGGKQHDYGFGSIGTALESFGVRDLKSTPGSLAAEGAWGEKIGADGDIIGHPNQPYWNPPPGNGYGFFFNVRRAAAAEKTWGGIWTVGSPTQKLARTTWDATVGAATDHITKLRMHLVGDAAEPIYADAPGLYPRMPLSSYVLARRTGNDLKSTFLATYEPYAQTEQGSAPRLDRVERLGEKAVTVQRRDGMVDILLFGAHRIESVYGAIEFDGDFAYLSGDGKKPLRAETLGCKRLAVDGRVLTQGAGAVSGRIAKVDTAACAVELDTELPTTAEGQMAVFSNPLWTRTSAYRVVRVSGRHLALDATALSLGVGRVAKQVDPQTISSDVPHEYVKTMFRTPTRFFDGKLAVGRSGGSTRVKAIKPGTPHQIAVENSAALKADEMFDYMDLSAGDQVRIALPQVWTDATATK
ncbi:MAG: hypothetical protein HZA31_07545 [Opitutae bacterium]|nr:hypothetical protein [Opitutae bacterium]